MTDENWKIQVSPRVGDTLINLRAQTGEEMLAILGWYEQNSASIASALGTGAAGAAVGQTFAGPGTGNVPQEQGWAQQGSQQSAPPPFAQQAAPQGGPGPAPSCVHGQMLYKSGIGKTGKPWQAWMCTAPKGQSCEPNWIR